ncbi:MAG: Arc family DNA-binding protein [Alphaproteobacteria bacterium]|nr:Arc family DNA-binding protein [Alphaproteobacteria bacterium]
MTKLSRLTFRMPSDMRAWLIRRAKRNAASLNSEIVRVLREKMDEETKTTT